MAWALFSHLRASELFVRCAIYGSHIVFVSSVREHVAYTIAIHFASRSCHLDVLLTKNPMYDRTATPTSASAVYVKAQCMQSSLLH